MKILKIVKVYTDFVEWSLEALLAHIDTMLNTLMSNLKVVYAS